MGDDGAAGLLALARELDVRDADVAGRIETVSALLRRVDDVTSKARRVRTRLDVIPAEIAHTEQDEREARVREAELRQELEEAERELDRVRGARRAGEEARSSAERTAQRASVAAADAATGVARARGRIEALVREEAALQAEGERLAADARAVAAEVARLPRVSESGRTTPGGTLAEIEEWGARVHAALFVVRGGLETERDRLVLEANGLAAAVLGDHAGGSSVALVRRRIEGVLGDGTQATG